MSRQNFSDFLESRREITVYIKNDLTLLAYDGFDRTTTKRIFSTDGVISFCHQDLNLPSSWELFSTSFETDFSCVTTPPEHWYICNTMDTTYLKPAKAWPEPEIMHAGNILKSENYGILPVDTTQSAYFLNIDSVIIVVISAPLVLEKNIAALLFEKTDIVILRVSSLTYAESIRETLRPRLLISSSGRPEGSSPSNCVFTEERPCAIDLQISPGKKITVSDIRQK
ncbi:MAG: hypothetical protein JW915_17720 [Chitinispirillaceae bacterium]|nr:hypothetical protein [Chitinispirillaceae bacterium]